MWQAAVAGAAAAFDRELYAIDHCLALRTARYVTAVPIESGDIWSFAHARGAPTAVLLAIDRAGRHVLMSPPPPPAAAAIADGHPPGSRVCSTIAVQVIHSHLTLAKDGWYNTALSAGAIGCTTDGAVVLSGCHGLTHQDTNSGARQLALDALTTTLWHIIGKKTRSPPEATAALCGALDDRATAALLYALQPQSMSVITEPFTVVPPITSFMAPASGGPAPANAMQPWHPCAVLPTTNVPGDACAPARVLTTAANDSVASHSLTTATSPSGGRGTPESTDRGSVTSVTSTTDGALPSTQINIVPASSPTIGPGPAAQTYCPLAAVARS